IEIPKPVPKYVYKNRFGLEAYINKNVMSLYEPGSVFKPIVMAIGFDAGEVRPNETYNETGAIEIDTGTGEKQYIRTALHVYRGIQTMTNAIEQSSNIGMAYVARKLGKELFYKYVLDFGFGDYTYVDLPNEQKGKLTYWKSWSEAQLLTTSFGQGIAVTPIQMTSSWCALANGGVLMQPKVIKEFIRQDGKVDKIDDKVIRRVISETTSRDITGVLVSSVEKGVAKAGKVPGYKLAGKTGTSQIACSDSSRCHIGFYEAGMGTTVTSYGGYGPINKPKFVVLVKFERARLSGATWGENTAAPVFKELVKFLMNYYDIAPDDPESLAPKKRR
ncbi:MAG TPA: penicillin-binding transpeptidase domain-containing protein, partial [Candidatus Gracilibacteria bacterium]|nr:penicillin-binding transpeptidase domain-containing protein [Candidatus Gracilibacteria bacterium]